MPRRPSALRPQRAPSGKANASRRARRRSGTSPVRAVPRSRVGLLQSGRTADPAIWLGRPGLVYPSIADVPPTIHHRTASEVEAQLGLTLLDAGLADPAEFNGDPHGFLLTTLNRHLKDAGGDYVSKALEYTFALSQSVTSYPELDRKGMDDVVVLSSYVEQFAYAPVAPLLDQLEAAQPKLAATCYRIWVNSLRHFFNEVYDWEPAFDEWENYTDQLGEGETTEYTNPQAEAHPSQLLSAPTLTLPELQRITKRIRSPLLRMVLQATELLEKDGREQRVNWTQPKSVDDAMQYADIEVIPTFVFVGSRGDATDAFFDSNVQNYGQVSTCPDTILGFHCRDVDACRRAFGVMKMMVRVLRHGGAIVRACLHAAGMVSTDNPEVPWKAW